MYGKARSRLNLGRGAAIQGATYTLALAGASAITRTMEYKDVSFDQFASALLKPFGIPYKVEGGQTPQFKFPRINMPHGISVFDLLDEHARNLGIGFTSDPTGAFVAVVGPNGGGDILEEGKNVLEGREIIFNAVMESSAPAITQGPGSDKAWGADVSHVPYVTQEMQKLGDGYRPFVSRWSYRPSAATTCRDAHKPNGISRQSIKSKPSARFTAGCEPTASFGNGIKRSTSSRRC
jgi:prophage tail gpP-like protein